MFLEPYYNILKHWCNYACVLKITLVKVLILKLLIMKLKHIFYSLCAATLMFACTNEPLTEPKETLLEANSKGIANAPTESGVYVLRSEDYVWGWIISDSKTNLTAVLGWDLESQLSWCSGNFDLDLLDLAPIQLIDLPNNENKFVELQQGMVRTIVFDGAFSYLYPFCDFVDNAEVLAEGLSRFTYTDNDLLGYISDGNNYNSWTYRGSGTLIGSSDGKDKHFSAVMKLLWNWDNEWDILSDIRHISVQLR